MSRVRSPRSEALRALGMAKRAGFAAVGTRAVLTAARAGDLRAVVVSRDATDNARKRLAIALQRVPTVELGESGELGAAVGRSRVVVVGLTDDGMAARILAHLGRPAAS